MVGFGMAAADLLRRERGGVEVAKAGGGGGGGAREAVDEDCSALGAPAAMEVVACGHADMSCTDGLDSDGAECQNGEARKKRNAASCEELRRTLGVNDEVDDLAARDMLAMSWSDALCGNAAAPSSSFRLRENSGMICTQIRTKTTVSSKRRRWLGNLATHRQGARRLA